jgi:hypothetical protein
LPNRQANSGRVGTLHFGVGGLEDVEALVSTKYVDDQAVGTPVGAESAVNNAATDLATSTKAFQETAVEARADNKYAEDQAVDTWYRPIASPRIL